MADERFGIARVVTAQFHDAAQRCLVAADKGFDKTVFGSQKQISPLILFGVGLAFGNIAVVEYLREVVGIQALEVLRRNAFLYQQLGKVAFQQPEAAKLPEDRPGRRLAQIVIGGSDAGGFFRVSLPIGFGELFGTFAVLLFVDFIDRAVKIHADNMFYFAGQSVVALVDTFHAPGVELSGQIKAELFARVVLGYVRADGKLADKASLVEVFDIGLNDGCGVFLQHENIVTGFGYLVLIEAVKTVDVAVRGGGIFVGNGKV